MRAMRIDFLRERRPAPWQGWVLLLIGMALLLLVAGRYQEARARQDATLARASALAQSKADLQRQRQAQLAPARAYLDDKRWQRAAAELARPWEQTLQALEDSARPPVFLLAVRADPTSGRLQLDAEAPRLDDALNYVTSLQGGRAVSMPQLASHETIQDAQGQTAVRFVVRAHWSAP